MPAPKDASERMLEDEEGGGDKGGIRALLFHRTAKDGS